jgi:hypothetical protein
MKKVIFIAFTFLYSGKIFAQFDKYYSDEVPSSSSSLGLWIAGIAIISILIFGGKDARKSIIYFCALFALPLILGKIGFLFFGMFGSLVGGLLGCYIWFRLGAWLDSE